MSKKLIVLLFSILLGITVFLGLRYVNVSHEENRLEAQLQEVDKEIMLLEGQLASEWASGSIENQDQSSTLERLKLIRSRAQELKEYNHKKQEHIFSLIREIKHWRKENAQLKDGNRALTEKNILLEQENAQFNARFNSLAELKEAIREQKIKMWQSSAEWRALQGTKDDSLDGNLGYLMKDGVSTNTRVKIEVTPLK